MKKVLITFFFTCFCCIFLVLLLFYSKECITLASNGLLIWYRNMIPSLFPFMVLSGFMVRSGLSLKIGQWMQPILGIFFMLPSHMLYAIFMGFLCGFPMGAKIVADMLEKEQITLKEGEFLLAFCNNIGPLYMLGYVIPLFGYQNVWKILGLMYLVPFGYGLILRYLSFKLYINADLKNTNKKKTLHTLSACSYPETSHTSPNYLMYFQQSLSSAIEQITMLGGCMVFFNCLLIFPEMLGRVLSKSRIVSYSPLLTAFLSSLVEIGGGLQQLASAFFSSNDNSHLQIHTSLSTLTNFNIFHVYLPLALLTFGGLSCIAQTYFITKNTELKISTYIKHKIIQSCIYILFILLNL